MAQSLLWGQGKKTTFGEPKVKMLTGLGYEVGIEKARTMEEENWALKFTMVAEVRET